MRSAASGITHFNAWQRYWFVPSEFSVKANRPGSLWWATNCITRNSRNEVTSVREPGSKYYFVRNNFHALKIMFCGILMEHASKINRGKIWNSDYFRNYHYFYWISRIIVTTTWWRLTHRFVLNCDGVSNLGNIANMSNIFFWYASSSQYRVFRLIGIFNKISTGVGYSTHVIGNIKICLLGTDFFRTKGVWKIDIFERLFPIRRKKIFLIFPFGDFSY